MMEKVTTTQKKGGRGSRMFDGISPSSKIGDMTRIGIRVCLGPWTGLPFTYCHSYEHSTKTIFLLVIPELYGAGWEGEKDLKSQREGALSEGPRRKKRRCNGGLTGIISSGNKICQSQHREKRSPIMEKRRGGVSKGTEKEDRLYIEGYR